MKTRNLNKLLFVLICFVPFFGRSQISTIENCTENLYFKEEFFNNIKVVESLIYKIQNEEFLNSLKFISKYAHVSTESMANYSRTYPGGYYEEDRKKWISWYDKNKCKNIQFKKLKNLEIYFQNGIAYDKSTNKFYSGIAQTYNKNGVKFEEFYQNGKLNKTLLYYNINSEQIVSDETLYIPEKNKKIKHIRFSSDGNKYWETIFDENERKSEFNFFEKEILKIHEEYINGKKNGIWFCLSDDGTICETEYKIGRKIKDCN
ncbi:MULTISPECIES: hypothetical protein [Chryseobacterium]|uniref:hypothetical protein n=1 Tax=Chryseobacterium TaxID=59732 RepID=UPI000C9E365F|nr:MULTISPECIES: hypothetical protein [Chryseobacterium]VXB67158.1 conserved hypothetical protein [Chryseobacterium sp. 8AT]